MRSDLPWPELRAALERGDIAVLLTECAPDIEAARAASRALCALAVAACDDASLHTSRSATPGLAAVALCRDAAVGIDVECIRPELIDADLLQLALHPAENTALPQGDAQGFFELWTRKEAVLKALGLGVGSLDLTAVHVGCGGAQHVELEGQSLVVDALDAGAGFRASLAVVGSYPAAIKLRTQMMQGAETTESRNGTAGGFIS